MKFNEQKQQYLNSLIESGIERNEALIELDLIIQKFTGLSKKDFILNPNVEVSSTNINVIEDSINLRISNKKPVQYILNEAVFMGENFYVDENVLIPRDETELLVNETIKIINNYNKTLSMVDIGTGSGCIACMLAKLTGQNIFAVDISTQALTVAKKNAKSLNIEDKATFIQSDLFDNIDKNLKFDVIVSNPPYIPISERETLQSEVTLHEPHLALFADDVNGIEIYKKIIEQSKQYLNKNGYILFELGINQSEIVSDVFIKNGFKIIDCIKDFGGIDRVLIGQKL